MLLLFRLIVLVTCIFGDFGSNTGSSLIIHVKAANCSPEHGGKSVACLRIIS